MKKIILIFVGILAILGIVFGAYKLFFSKNSKSLAEEEILEEVTVLPPIAERPYIFMSPTSDNHRINIDVSNLKGTKVEYELLYYAGETPRGAIGKEVLNGKSQFSRELMFGSCSSGGKCSFDEGVESGGLTLKIASGSKSNRMEAPFKIEKGGKNKTFSTSDNKFTISGNLPTANFLIYSPLGLPSPFENGKIVSEPYQVTSSGSQPVKMTISITLSENTPNANVYGWDKVSKTWKKYSTKMETDGSTISVEVDQLTTYLVAAAS